MDYKTFKDPIYGYVRIDKAVLNEIIDTACFQRLRHIRQTSYAPLYSAALHNRFTHSIGVYHLGKLAFFSLKKSAYENYTDDAKEINWDKQETIFTLACLLHDVGHAPFSHSGEQFYLHTTPPNEEQLYIDLKASVGDMSFSNDMTYYHDVKKKPAAPHEIMSTIVALKAFSQYFPNKEDRSLFARCITGYQYRDVNNFQLSMQNALVSLLNSSIIDVDKLDYLIRDSYVTGYDSISIDYERLLNSVSIRYIGSKYELVYNKSALSVLENVIYAHDSERKWIQNHPIVLYEHFLVQHAIRSTSRFFAGSTNEKLFCKESLLEEGKLFGNTTKISLLCDDDIIYLMKNECGNDLTREYFSRNLRRHPVWKSEAEYKTMFIQPLGKETLDRLEIQFGRLEKFLNEELNYPIVNEEALQKCESVIERIESTTILSEMDKKAQLESYKSIYMWMTCLKEFSNKTDIPFDYVIIGASHFKSGFQKEDLKNTKIYFPNLNKLNNLGEVVNLLDAHSQRDKFFYLYYRRKNGRVIDVNSLTKMMCLNCLEH